MYSRRLLCSISLSASGFFSFSSEETIVLFQYFSLSCSHIFIYITAYLYISLCMHLSIHHLSIYLSIYLLDIEPVYLRPTAPCPLYKTKRGAPGTTRRLSNGVLRRGPPVTGLPPRRGLTEGTRPARPLTRTGRSGRRPRSGGSSPYRTVGRNSRSDPWFTQ